MRTPELGLGEVLDEEDHHQWIIDEIFNSLDTESIEVSVNIQHLFLLVLHAFASQYSKEVQIGILNDKLVIRDGVDLTMVAFITRIQRIDFDLVKAVQLHAYGRVLSPIDGELGSGFRRILANVPHHLLWHNHGS